MGRYRTPRIGSSTSSSLLSSAQVCSWKSTQKKFRHIRIESTTLPEWTFGRKRISANSNLNPNSNPNPKAKKRFGENKMTSFFSGGKCPETVRTLSRPHDTTI